MNDMTVSSVSKAYGVSTRMLRYYEKEGLITCKHIEDYAYRIYDETAVRRLQQILLLRKLRIPLKQIKIILNADDPSGAISIFSESIQRMDIEIASMQVIRDILTAIIDRSTESPLSLLEDETLRLAISVLPPSKKALKEKHMMNELIQASEKTIRPESVRVLYLPPCTVASYHYIGADPEEKVGEIISRFVQESGLYKLKPDSRLFGFNHPDPGVLDGIHGYENWISIPDDMELPEYLEKKHFPGGMYAVLTIPFPEFQLWDALINWVNSSEQYEADYSSLGAEIMSGCLEEHLNWVYAAHHNWPEDGPDGQIDLMLPIKRRK